MLAELCAEREQVEEAIIVLRMARVRGRRRGRPPKCRYQVQMVSRLATQATARSALRPRRFPISARVERFSILTIDFERYSGAGIQSLPPVWPHSDWTLMFERSGLLLETDDYRTVPGQVMAKFAAISSLKARRKGLSLAAVRQVRKHCPRSVPTCACHGSRFFNDFNRLEARGLASIVRRGTTATLHG
jgi:hypothetical protein